MNSPAAPLNPRDADSPAGTLLSHASESWLRRVRLGGFIVLIGCLITPCAWPIATMLTAQGSLRETIIEPQPSGDFRMPASNPVPLPTSIPSMPPARPPRAPTFPAEPPEASSEPPSLPALVPPARDSKTAIATTAQTQPATSPDLSSVEALMSRKFPDPHPITPIGLAPSTAPTASVSGGTPMRVTDPAAPATPVDSGSSAPTARTTTVNLGSPVPAAIFITLWTALIAAGVFLVTTLLPSDPAVARLQCWLARAASLAPLFGIFSLFAPDNLALQMLQALAVLVFLGGWPLYWLRVAHLLREAARPVRAWERIAAGVALALDVWFVFVAEAISSFLPAACSRLEDRIGEVKQVVGQCGPECDAAASGQAAHRKALKATMRF